MKNLSGPAFFKIMHKNDDFDSKILIPPCFVEKYGVSLSPKATLETDQSGNSWDVKIEEIDDCYWLTHGWVKFVEENNINLLDLLIFQLVADSRILVQIFDKDGYKRDASTHIFGQENPTTKHRIDIITSSSSEESSTLSFHEESNSEGHASEHFHTNMNISFIFTWQKYLRSLMMIKMRICKKIGLYNKQTLKLKNLAGDIHEVNLFKTHDNRVGLGKGWAAFTKTSNFALGRIYRFEFIRDSNDELVLQLSLLKSNTT